MPGRRELLDSRIWRWRSRVHAQRAVALEVYDYRVRIAYKGTHYHGWQSQSADVEQESQPSVQGTIQRHLRTIARYQDCSITGTSRTDAGVHAQGQIAKISLPVDLEPVALLRGLNSMLPASIRILDCARCSREFNPQVGATAKEYHYYFDCNPVPSPLLTDVVVHIPGPLDLGAMGAAASVFLGEHDFYGFCRRSTSAATTVRTIESLDVLQPHAGHPLASSVHTLRIIGNGFLKQMIRYMVSALFEVARGRLRADDILAQLHGQPSEKLCACAPARGLHLVRVLGLS